MHKKKKNLYFAYIKKKSQTSLQEVEYQSPTLGYAQWLPSTEHTTEEKGERKSTSEQPDKHNLGQVIKVNINSDITLLLTSTLDMMWWEWHFTLGVFLLKAHHPNLTMRKASDKPKLKDTLLYVSLWESGEIINVYEETNWYYLPLQHHVTD